jgi:hypothetical protein
MMEGEKTQPLPVLNEKTCLDSRQGVGSFDGYPANWTKKKS